MVALCLCHYVLNAEDVAVNLKHLPARHLQDEHEPRVWAYEQIQQKYLERDRCNGANRMLDQMSGARLDTMMAVYNRLFHECAQDDNWGMMEVFYDRMLKAGLQVLKIDIIYQIVSIIISTQSIFGSIHAISQHEFWFGFVWTCGLILYARMWIEWNLIRAACRTKNAHFRSSLCVLSSSCWWRWWR